MRSAAAIIEDARHPNKYRMLLQMVDVIFADVAQPDQARIVALNAHMFLKNEGGLVISIKASCIDSTAKPEVVFANEVKKLQNEMFKPREQLTLEPYVRHPNVFVLSTFTHFPCLFRNETTQQLLLSTSGRSERSCACKGCVCRPQ